MTINELVAKIEQVKEQISDCEYSLNHIQTTTPESYKQVFTSDWEWKKVGGAVRDTSGERSSLESKLRQLKSELKDLEQQLKWAEKDRQDKFFAQREAKEKERDREEQEKLQASWTREQKEINWRAKCDAWNAKSGLYRFFHMRKHPSKIYEKLDEMSVEEINKLYR